MKLKNRIASDNKITDSNLLPLVNIIFLLLIFFLLAGVIEKKRDLLGVEIPQATLQQFTEKEQPELHLYSNGTIKFDGATVTLKNLTKNMENKYPQINELELLVTADSSVTSKSLNEVLLALDKSKIKKINLLTLKNE